ncbi:MAG TPA: DUF559 domain-containing protein [Jatrophihabitans sp.]|nr:DUF559 domain-containing protein [Jatrophihabitans sp.]
MEPDPDWYLEHVVVASGPERALVGPVRQHQAAWLATARHARETAGELRAAVELSLRQGFVLTPDDLRRLHVAPAIPRRLVRRREWSRPRRGTISPLPLADGGHSGTCHEIAAAAAALVWPGMTISHASATAIRGLPLLKPPGRPTLTVDHWYRSCTRDDIRLHIAALWRDDFDDWFGAPITTIPRTIIDLARARGVRDGLVAADAALHEHLTTPAELRRVLARQRGWPGVQAARRAIDLADHRAESPLESLARLCLIDGGLPTPELQVWIDTAVRPYRVDMLFRAQRVIVELDGLGKYRGDPRALAEEKIRQEHLERAGYRVVRLLWDDIVRRPAESVARVRAALAARG